MVRGVVVALAPLLVVDRANFLAHSPAPKLVLESLEGRCSRGSSRANQIDPAHDQTASVAEVADVRRAARVFHEEHERDQPDRLDRHGRKNEHQGSVWPSEGKGQDDPHHRARCSERGDL